MSIHETSLMYRCRRILLRKAWLWMLLVLFMVLIQSARGYTLAGSKVQFVQLCTQQGMVNVAVDAAPSASNLLSTHSSSDCCGCCSVALGAPPVIAIVEKPRFADFILAELSDAQIPVIALNWSPARPQPPPVVSSQSDLLA